MIVIEISDESIVFLIQFLVFSFIIGWFIVQWDLNRMTKKRQQQSTEKKRRKPQHDKE